MLVRKRCEEGSCWRRSRAVNSRSRSDIGQTVGVNARSPNSRGKRNGVGNGTSSGDIGCCAIHIHRKATNLNRRLNGTVVIDPDVGEFHIGQQVDVVCGTP